MSTTQVNAWAATSAGEALEPFQYELPELGPDQVIFCADDGTTGSEPWTSISACIDIWPALSVLVKGSPSLSTPAVSLWKTAFSPVACTSISPLSCVPGMKRMAEFSASASSMASQTVTVRAGLKAQNEASWCQGTAL